MDIFYIIIYSYFLGSIPFGLIYSKILGYGDIRKIGSGNIGATNALRTGSKLLALLTLLSDIFKGSIAVLCTIKFYPEYYYLSAVVVYLAHIFPIWLKFKGGKGVATFIGIILVINHISFLIFVISWLVVSKLLKISSLSALVAFAILLVSSLFLQSLEETIFYFFFFAFSVFTHRENIARLLAGNEKKL